MQHIRINLDESRQETTMHGSYAFPLAIYHCNLKDYFNQCSPWHWHKAIEFNLVLKGSCDLLIRDKSLTIESGNGAFINTNVLHSQHPHDDSGCEFLFIILDPQLLSINDSYYLQHKYVQPILQNEGITAIPLSRGSEWQKLILDKILECDRAYQKQDYGFEYSICSSISQIWYSMILALQNPAAIQPNTYFDDDRLKNMLFFINNMYMEPITLEDIAKSGNLSVRMCNRCFKDQLRTTPIAYLISYRIHIASKLLVSTRRSITEISSSVGFNNASHFSQVFQKLTGKTPLAYREDTQSCISND